MRLTAIPLIPTNSEQDNNIQQPSNCCVIHGHWKNDQQQDEYEVNNADKAPLLLAYAWKPIVTGLLPLLPWTFPNVWVLYYLALVPLLSARVAMPRDIRILFFFSWTIGVVSIIKWKAIFVGPYREVAVLSALVKRNFNLGIPMSMIYN